MTTLYICEKPSLAAVVANHLFKGTVKKGPECYDGGDIKVTWAYGHLLNLASPEAYGKNYKFWNNYPIFPKQWILQCKADTKSQLIAIQKLLKISDVVVNVGDPDREGQLLIDEILYYSEYKGTVKRLLLPALDEVNVSRAFKNIRDNREMFPLYLSGLCRDKADWLVGMNLSRAYTVSSRKYGYLDRFIIGRVKIPTLALVVKREEEINNFKPKDFYELIGTFSKDSVQFHGKLTYDDSYPIDSENRLIDKNFITNIYNNIKNLSFGTVLSTENKTEKKHAPLPHSLDTLQVEANKKYDFSPTEVLKMVQSMYEKKFVTYPRSDCNYIPEAQFEDAPKILSMLKTYGIKGADNADTNIKSSCWNDKKVTAHNAIIPTMLMPSGLTEDEQKIYNLIAFNYILQFYPPCIIDAASFKLKIGQYIFKGNGKKIISPGFTAIIPSSVPKKSNEDALLPALITGDSVHCTDFEIVTKTTTPPERYTEGTLLKAMSNIWTLFKPNDPLREKLKETKGIGTPATRNVIIAELQGIRGKKKDNEKYIKKYRKYLYPTDLGKFLIANIDPSLTSPATTATMEFALSEIAEGKQDPDTYIQSVQNMILKNIQYAESHHFPFSTDLESCPICHKGRLVRIFVKSTQKYLFVCSEQDCVHPITNKKVFYAMNKEKHPVIYECPNCHKKPLTYHSGEFGDYWSCDFCKYKYKVNNNKLSTSNNSSITQFLCPLCGKGHLKQKVATNRTTGQEFTIYFCENNCKDPADNKRLFYFSDIFGKPAIQKCPYCGDYHMQRSKNSYGYYWRCHKCNKFSDDKNGIPIKKQKKDNR